MNKGKRVVLVGLCTVFTLGLCGCGVSTINTFNNNDTKNIKEGNIALTDSFNQEATAIIVSKDERDQIIQFFDMQTGEDYDLRYNGATNIYNKYGEAISIAQLSTGNMVDYVVNAKTDTLKKITINSTCENYSSIENYSIKMGKMTIYGTEYDISPRVVIVSNNSRISIKELETIDVISAWVYRNNVVSINVEKGHGYLTLENEDYFINGWIEVNSSIIRKISDDMRLTIPEGENNIIISKKKTKINQSVYIERGQKMVWDLANVEIIEPVNPVKNDKTEEQSQEPTDYENEAVDRLEKAYENTTFYEEQTQISTESSKENDTNATNNEKID